MRTDDGRSHLFDRAHVSEVVAKLKLLHLDEPVIAEVVGLGPKAVPDLKAILFERDRSGLFHVRCRAVEALTQLRAYDVLADYLRSDHCASDPVERLGDDVVIGTAARAISKAHEDWVFLLLMTVAQRHKLNGVINAVGAFRRKEAIPLLIEALAEDETRTAASAALRSIGAAARSSLAEAVLPPSTGSESESRKRQRRSALSLLLDIGVPKKLWPQLRSLMLDADAHVALLSCGLCLSVGGFRERSKARSMLQTLRRFVGWPDQQLIDSYLGGRV